MPLLVDSVLSVFSEDHQPQRGLPAAAYIEQEFWEEECRTVFAENWVFAGFAHEIPKPGDVIPITIAGRPILLLRDRAGAVAAFHNVCRHRCLQLVSEPKNTGNLIRCPYHAWAYGLDGGLRASPHFGGIGDNRPHGFDPAANGLVPIRATVWHDWIFVNLDGRAPAFADYAAALVERLDGIDFSKVKPLATLDFGELPVNWKLIMENFIEPYHVQFVHRTTTDQPLADHYTIIDGQCFGSAVDLSRETGRSSRLAVSSRYLALFPTFILGRYFPDQLGVYLNIPLGSARMVQKRVIYATDDKVYSQSEIDQLRQLWWDVHKEDHEMCTRMQTGRSSPIAESGGLLSPVWEDSVRAFQERVMQSVGNGREAGG